MKKVRFTYNFLFTIAFLLSAPYYFWRLRRRGHWQKGFAQRFGKFDTAFKQSITNRHVVWLHAVSVGEVNLCARIVHALELRMPNLKLITSTTTTTGMGELKKNLPTRVGKFYYPIDWRPYVNRALAALHPEAVVLVESEIWPNFLWRLGDKQTPVFLINARLSDRSYSRYRKLGWFFRPLFASFAGVGAQTEADAVRLRELGCRAEAVHVIGSLKFDAANHPGGPGFDAPGLLRQLGVPAGARILVAGSTHAGEEELLAGQFTRLRKQFPDLFLVLVPRHFERGREVGDILRKHGLRFAFRNGMSRTTTYPPGQLDCLLVNTTGELRAFYACATVVFVGKSITARGGQNPIEPAVLGKAVVFGPNMQNFTEVVRTFLDQDGAVQVKDAAGLEAALADLFARPERREELANHARKVVDQNLGAVDRTVEMITKHLQGSEIYIPAERHAGLQRG